MENAEPKKSSRFPGRFRWAIVLIIVLNVLAVGAVSPIISPHITVAAEPVFGPWELPLLGTFYVTNSMIGTFIADVVLFLLALSVRLSLRKDTLYLSGIPGVVETLVDSFHNLVEGVAGRWTQTIFPWMATIFLLVITVNYVELFPGVETIGLTHEPHSGLPVYESEVLFTIGDLEVRNLLREVEVDSGELEHHEEEAVMTSGEGEHPEAGAEHKEEGLAGFVGFVRPAATDLNFTIALALISVTVTQIVGLRALGIGYLTKFFDFGPFVRMWGRPKLGPFDVIMPFIGIFVGLLELIAEFAKILSFSFRLFGNIFAGSVLLIIIGSLIPVLAFSGVLFLELFVGAVQAFVFAMLTLVFMVMATQGHGDHEEEHEPA